MNCPHCDKTIKAPPSEWSQSIPWHCSDCGGLFGADAAGVFKIPDGVKPVSPLLGYQTARRWLFYAGRQNFYTYALCYPSGLPFYVGQGCFERALSHVAETRSIKPERRTRKHDTIESIWAQNEDVWYCFLGLFKTREESIVLENWYIDFYGLRSHGGMLTNTAGMQCVNCDFPLSHVGFPEEPEIVHHPDAIGKWKHSIRVFHHADFVVPPPAGKAIVSGAVTHCPACGNLGQLTRHMRNSKLLCSYCGHYFIHTFPPQRVEDGSQRQFFSHMPDR